MRKIKVLIGFVVLLGVALSAACTKTQKFTGTLKTKMTLIANSDNKIDLADQFVEVSFARKSEKKAFLTVKKLTPSDSKILLDSKGCEFEGI